MLNNVHEYMKDKNTFLIKNMFTEITITYLNFSSKIKIQRLRKNNITWIFLLHKGHKGRKGHKEKGFFNFTNYFYFSII